MAAPLLVYTPGEPAGIGPDLALQLASREAGFPCITIADPELLAARAEQLGLSVTIKQQSGNSAFSAKQGELQCLAVDLTTQTNAGELNPANSPYVLKTLEVAVQGCRSGQFAAMVTGPVQKSVINDAGIAFSGHTEWLAQACDGVHPVMMLATPGLRVALASTHLPLREVADYLDESVIESVLRITHNDLKQRFGLKQPRISVCGLNPHAGENGHLGHEEREIIEPVIRRLNAEGMNLVGPLPADTAFTPPYIRDSDAFLAMYHDQGLPVLKYLGFGNAVNVTLGLPIIRTSVDHGTALDLAGSGDIDPGSLAYAIEVALSQLSKAA